MKITVYTTPDCVQCDSTKRQFIKHGVEFDSVDLSTDLDAMAMVRQLGYSAAPVVIAGDKHWSGFRMSEIKALVSELDLERGQK